MIIVRAALLARIVIVGHDDRPSVLPCHLVLILIIVVVRARADGGGGERVGIDGPERADVWRALVGVVVWRGSSVRRRRSVVRGVTGHECMHVGLRLRLLRATPLARALCARWGLEVDSPVRAKPGVSCWPRLTLEQSVERQVVSNGLLAGRGRAS